MRCVVVRDSDIYDVLSTLHEKSLSVFALTRNPVDGLFTKSCRWTLFEIGHPVDGQKSCGWMLYEIGSLVLRDSDTRDILGTLYEKSLSGLSPPPHNSLSGVQDS